MDHIKNKRILASAITCALGLCVSQVSMADVFDVDITTDPTNVQIDTPVTPPGMTLFVGGDANANLSVIDILSAWNAGGDVYISATQTGTGATAESGIINIDAALDLDATIDSSLSFIATGDININDAIYDSSTGDIFIPTTSKLELDFSTSDGVVRLNNNALLGVNSIVNINGTMDIGNGASYALLHEGDSLTVDSVILSSDSLAGESILFRNGSLTIHDEVNINSTGYLRDGLTGWGDFDFRYFTLGAFGGTHSLHTASLVIGDDLDTDSGTFTQLNGSNTVDGALTIKTGGTYNMVGGNLTAGSIVNTGVFAYTDGGVRLTASDMTVANGELLGSSLSINSGEEFGAVNQNIGIDNANTGSVSQDGGNNTVEQALTINDGSSYTQSGGTNTANTLNINEGGSYALNGGTLSANTTNNSGAMTVADVMNIGVAKVYNLLTGGSLSSNSMVVDGEVNQQAGSTNTVTTDLAINDGGSYTLSGGSLTAGDISRSATGIFDYTGGDLTINTGILAVETDGLLGAAVTIGDGQNLHTASQSVGTVDASSGTVAQTGGSNTVDGTLVINAGGAYGLNGGSLTAGAIDKSVGGSFNWSAGDLTLTNGDLAIDNNGLVGQSLTLNATKNLRAVNQTVGTVDANSGSITQQISSNNTVDNLLTINSGGSYTLDRAVLSAGSVNNDGIINQQGGSITSIAGALTVNAGGAYNLAGGSLTSGSIDNSGTISHTVGNNTVNGALTINSTGSYAQSNGSNNIAGALAVNAGGDYSISRGTLIADSVSNSGSITQSGASSVSVANALTVADGGNYNQIAGTLSADSIETLGTLTTSGSVSTGDMTVGTIDPNSGSVSQTGYTNITNALTVNTGGSYDHTGSSLHANSLVNSGSIIQSGGADIGVTTSLTMNAGSTYNLNGGYGYWSSSSTDSYLSAGSINNSGDIVQTGSSISSTSQTIHAGGSHTQSRGYNSVNDDLNINAGGSYNLSGSDYYYDANYSKLSSTNLINDGNFTQSGGYNSVSNILTVGAGGTYTMSGGTLSVGEIVRNGAFVYTGGELHLNNSNLIVNTGGLLGSSVSIASGQSFSAVNQIVDNGGEINQTGGLNSADDILTINAGGTYNLSGGTLSADSVLNNGSFYYTAGSVQLRNSDLFVDGTGLLGADLNILNNESFDANNQFVGTGAAASGSINQTGGYNHVDDVLTINTGGTYTLTGGSLDVGSIVNNGAFIYNDGSVRLRNDDLAIDNDTGLLGDTINITGSKSFGSVNQSVGTAIAGSGFVNQTGGYNNVDNLLTINAGGTYTMSGGSLVAGDVINNGTFAYSGGAVKLTDGDLAVDNTGLLGDTVNIGYGQSFGSVNQTIGVASNGVITQIGGSNTIEKNLTVAADGVYNLGGNWNCYSCSKSYLDIREYINGSYTYGSMNVAGQVNQTGAIATLADMTISDGGVYDQSSGRNTVRTSLNIELGGSYNLSGGELNVADIINNGSFNFTGGTLDLGRDLAIAADGLLGGNVTIDSTKHLVINGSGGSNAISVDSSSSLTLNGGSIVTSSINNNNYTSSFAFISGNLNLSSNLTIGTGGLLTENVQLSSSRVLDVNGSVTVNSNGVLAVNGGTDNEFNSLTNGGSVSVTSGRLNTSVVSNSGTVTISDNATMSSEWNGSSSPMSSYVQNNGTTTIDGVLNTSSFVQDNGTTTVNGTLMATAASIEGGLLNGSGRIEGDLSVSSGGIVNAGNSVGDLEIAGNFALSSNGTLVLEVGDDPSAAIGDYLWDQLIAESYEMTSGNVEFSLFDSVGIDIFTADFSIDDFLRIGDRSENFGYLEYGLLIDSLSGIKFSAFDSTTSEWSKLILDSNGSFSVSAVPVPAAMWLFGSGLLGLIGVARRRAC